MTKHTKRSWLVGSLAAAAAVMGGGLAEGQDEIIVRGSSRFALALKPLGGSARERMAGELRRMLEDSGYFKLGPQSAEAFVVSGGSGGTQVDGVLEGSQGQELFRRRYRSANFRTNVARLADDIIEAVSGVPRNQRDDLCLRGKESREKGDLSMQRGRLRSSSIDE